MNNILKNAIFFEFQGLRDEALNYYKLILEKDLHNKEALLAISRLCGNRKKFLGVDKQKRDFFIKADREDLKEFEKWLIEN